MPVELKTPRLLLRRLSPHDAPAVFAYRADPNVSRYQTWHPTHVTEIATFIAGLQTLAPDTPGTWFQFAITQQDTGRLIGDCGVRFPADDPHQVEIGITLAPASQRQGYATETLRALLDYAFEDLAKHRVYARVDPRNGPSRALMARVGMRDVPAAAGTRRFDDVVYAMLNWEWRARG